MDELAHRSMAAAQERHWWFRGRRLLIDLLLASSLPAEVAKRRLLEIGSGTGGNLSVLTRHGDVTAVEMSEFANEVARALHPEATFVTAPWPEAASQVGRFDAVLMLDVLEHLDDDANALKAVHGHLSPAGCVLISVPAYQWMWSDHDVQLWHRRRYTQRQLRSLAEQAGFRVELLSGYNAVLLPMAWLARRLRLPGGTGDTVPAAPLNSLFGLILRAEARLIARGWRLPAGLSIVAVLREAR